MDYDKWNLTYRLKVKPKFQNGKFLFTTSEEDLDYLRNMDEKLVWTEFDDGSEIFIENGLNETEDSVTGYLVTENPWIEGERLRIFIGEYILCGCLSEEDLEPDEDCHKCYGEGKRLEWLTGDFDQITPE